jgi:uncharacterized protein (DUF1499 family)
MSIVKWVLIVLVGLPLLALLAGRLGLLQGRQPTGLGVHDGRLKAPSKTPNSVSSQASLHADHPQRSYAEIAPLAMRGSGPDPLARIKAVVEGMRGASVVRSEPDYLYAQFTTPLMKFVDDTEFWYDPAANVIQVRSASRVGRKDFGVNRARVEAIREQLAATP